MRPRPIQHVDPLYVLRYGEWRSLEFISRCECHSGKETGFLGGDGIMRWVDFLFFGKGSSPCAQQHAGRPRLPRTRLGLGGSDLVISWSGARWSGSGGLI